MTNSLAIPDGPIETLGDIRFRMGIHAGFDAATETRPVTSARADPTALGKAVKLEDEVNV